MRSILLTVFGVALVACDGDGEVGLDGGPGTTMTSDCEGTQDYVSGISATTPSGLEVAILDADPTPPDVGDNVWTVEVRDAGGPVSGRQLAVRPWMPLHGHGLSPATYGSTDLGDGTYEIETFDLIMPGAWEFTIDVGVAEGAPDEVLFTFCAEG